MADRLLKLLNGCKLHVDSYRRVVRRFVPDRMIAFVPLHTASWSFDNKDSTEYRPGAELCRTGRELCIHREVKEALIAEKLIKESECVGVLIVSKAPAGVEVIDNTCRETIPPLFPPALLAKLRKHETQMREELRKNLKPPRKATLKRSLELLKACRKANPDAFKRGATATQIEALRRSLDLPLPGSWEKVLRACNGAEIEPCELAADAACELIPAQQLAEFNQRQAKDCWFELPPGLLHVADSQIGDYIGLDTKSVGADGECRVLLVSHESQDVEKEWPTVAEFLEDLLAGAEMDE